MRGLALIGIGIALLAAACGTDSTEPSDSTTPSEATTSTTAPETTPVAPPSSDAYPIEAAIDDLSERLGVPAGAITLVSTESVEWNDGSLGCPQPGESYTQALVPGYRIVLEADDTTYVYHGADGRDPFLCDGRIADGQPRPRP